MIRHLAIFDNIILSVLLFKSNVFQSVTSYLQVKIQIHPEYSIRIKVSYGIFIIRNYVFSTLTQIKTGLHSLNIDTKILLSY